MKEQGETNYGQTGPETADGDVMSIYPSRGTHFPNQTVLAAV